MTPKVYARITIRPEGQRARTGWFEVLSEGPSLLLLRPVSKTGEDRSRYDAQGRVVDTQELVSVELVVSRQPAQMNRHYGELETVPQENR